MANETSDYPVLYVFVRTDIQSMTPGKAQAHSGHAANAFINENVIEKMQGGDKIDKNIWNWMQSTEHGFGTQINLKASWPEVFKAVELALDQKFHAGIISDPTYQYIVDDEIFGLIDKNLHSAEPVKLENNKWACSRVEQTAAYIFGMKIKLVDIVGQFQLHP